MSAFRLTLSAEPSAAKRLRNELHAWLLANGINGTTGRDLILAATEAFGNAVKHPVARATDTVQVEGELVEGTVVLTIRDDGRWLEKRDKEEGHYGYTLMEALVDAVQVSHGAGGTAITLRRAVSTPGRA